MYCFWKCSNLKCSDLKILIFSVFRLFILKMFILKKCSELFFVKKGKPKTLWKIKRKENTERAGPTKNCGKEKEKNLMGRAHDREEGRRGARRMSFTPLKAANRSSHRVPTRERSNRSIQPTGPKSALLNRAPLYTLSIPPPRPLHPPPADARPRTCSVAAAPGRGLHAAAWHHRPRCPAPHQGMALPPPAPHLPARPHIGSPSG